MPTYLRLSISVAAAALILLIVQWPKDGASEAVSSLPPAVAEAAARVEENPDDTASRIAFLQRLLQAYREIPDTAYLQLAENAIRDGQVLDASEPEYDFYAAQIALTRHHFAEALDSALAAIAARPTTARYYGVASDAYVELGKYDQAVEALQKMVDLRPDYSSYSRIAYVRELYGDVPGATQSFASAIAAGSAVPEHQAWGLTQKGHLLASADPAEAARLYQEAQRIQPEYAPALLGQAKVALAQGEYELTEKKLLAAFKAQPLPDYSMLIADFHAQQGNDAELQKYVRLTTLAFDAARSAGNQVDMEEADFLLSTGQEPERALALARSAHAVRPSVTAANILARAHLAVKDLPQARKHATEALRLTAETPFTASSPSIAATAGDLAAAEGDTDAARRWYETALRMDPAFSFSRAADMEDFFASAS